MPLPADSPALAIMAKRPQPGRTKTRLCPPLSAEQAAGLYEAFLRDVLASAGAVPGLQLAVAVTPPDEESMEYFQALVPPETLLFPIQAPTIGRCLDAVLTWLLERGHPMAAAVSSDTPTLSPELIRLGFARLEHADVVLSPGDDGGYYWVGIRSPQPGLFSDDIPWSTSGVAARTYSKARDLGLKVDLVPPMLDVDTVEELERLRQELARLPGTVAVHTRDFIRRLE